MPNGRYTGFDILDLLAPPAERAKRRQAGYTPIDPLDIMGPPASEPAPPSGYSALDPLDIMGPPAGPAITRQGPYTSTADVFGGPPMGPPVQRPQGVSGSYGDIFGTPANYPPITARQSTPSIAPSVPPTFTSATPTKQVARGKGAVRAKTGGDTRSPALDYSDEELFGSTPQATGSPSKIPELPQDRFSPEADKAIMAQAEKAGALGPLGMLGVILGETGSSIAGRGSFIPLVEAERERKRQEILGPYLAQKAEAKALAKEQRARDFEQQILGRKESFELGESEKDRALRIYLAQIAAGASAKDAAQRALDRASDRAQRAADTDERRKEAEAQRGLRSQDIRIQGFVNKVRDAALPESAAALENIEGLIAKAGEDLPGYGLAAGLLPNVLAGDAGRELRQAVQQLANMRLKARSGSAVTDNEYWRFLEELKGGTWSTEQQLRQGLKQMRQEIEATAKNLKGAISKDALAEYHARTESPQLQRLFGSEAPQEAAQGLSPEQQKRLVELRAKRQK